MQKQVRSIVRFLFEVGVFFFSTALAFVFFTAVYPLDTGEGATVIFPYVASVFVGGILYMMAYMIGGGEAKGVERGERLRPTWKIKLRSRWKTLLDLYPFFWGGVWYPFSAGVKSLAAVGAPGSGKSVNIRLFLQSILSKIGRVRDHRAILFDAVGNLFPILAGMGIDVSLARGLVRTLHPFDQRSWAWELWRDLRDFRTIDEIAVIFIPLQETGDPFWSNSARSLLKGVLKGLIALGQPWTLWDVCFYMRSLDRMKQLLEDTPETRHLIQKILEKGKASEGIDATLYSYMERYEVIAAIWKKIPPERHLSLTEWLTTTKGSILLLGRGARGTAHDAINQLIVERLGQLITIHQKESSTRRTWMVFDEIRQSGKLNLDPIATMGRAKGAVLVIGYQDQSGLEDAYNEKVATELLGMCQHKMYFLLGTEKTATYAAKDIGKQDYIDENGNEKERWVVHPNELTSSAHIPETNRRHGCTFYAKSVTYGAYKMRLRGRRLFGQMLRPPDMRVEGFIERPASDQYFHETPGAPESDPLELKREKPLEIETLEVQNDRERTAEERANAIENVKKRQREARERHRSR
jgi:ABC-type dipeptide/oligopeptide/nickel transport system ATPase component